MRSRGVWAAVVAVVVISGGFVVAGMALDASFYGVAAIIIAVALAGAALGLMALLLTLVGTIRELTRTVEQLTEQTVPLLGGINETVAGVNTEIARVDTIVAGVQHITRSAEGIADVVQAAVANPIIKAIAFLSGTGAALRSARRSGDGDE